MMLADKLREAGYPVARDRLYVAAVDCLKASDKEIAKALQPFLTRIKADDEILRELMRPALTGIALEYLMRRKEDMISGRHASGGQPYVDQTVQASVAAVNSSDVDLRGDASAGPVGCVPSQELAGGAGHGFNADEASGALPPAREPTLAEAARTMRRAPGSGAMKARAYETQCAVRGESWLLAYAIPDGPHVLNLTWYDARKIEERLFKEGGQRLLASVILAALRTEKEKLGQVSDDQTIGKSLPPAALAAVAEKYSPERVYEKGRAMLKQFQKDELISAGGPDAT